MQLKRLSVLTCFISQTSEVFLTMLGDPYQRWLGKEWPVVSPSGRLSVQPVRQEGFFHI